MGKAAAKRPAAKGRARAKGKRRPSGEPKCPKCRRGCWVGGCWEVAAGGCCWFPPCQEGVPHATACGKARSGVTPLVFLSPPSPVPAGWSRCGRRRRGEVTEAVVPLGPPFLWIPCPDLSVDPRGWWAPLVGVMDVGEDWGVIETTATSSRWCQSLLETIGQMASPALRGKSESKSVGEGQVNPKGCNLS